MVGSLSIGCCSGAGTPTEVRGPVPGPLVPRVGRCPEVARGSGAARGRGLGGSSTESKLGPGEQPAGLLQAVPSPSAILRARSRPPCRNWGTLASGAVVAVLRDAELGEDPLTPCLQSYINKCRLLPFLFFLFSWRANQGAQNHPKSHRCVQVGVRWAPAAFSSGLLLFAGLKLREALLLLAL